MRAGLTHVLGNRELVVVEISGNRGAIQQQHFGQRFELGHRARHPVQRRLTVEVGFVIQQGAAARGAFREVYPRAKPIILEPIMKLGVEGPIEFQGSVLKTILQRRGTVIGTTEAEGFCQVEAEVPLAQMFGYATDLRSNTQGKAEFTLEFSRYAPAPRDVTEELIKKYGTRVKGSDEE